LNKIIFFLSIVCHSVLAQDTPYSLSLDSIILLKEIKEYNAIAIHMTKTEQLFIQTIDHQIIKIDTAGKELLRYTNKYLGSPQFIYIENPLQLVMFYPSFQTIVILDQWMNEIKRVSLNDLRIPFVSTVGIGQDRSVWYYDDQVKRLKKITFDGQKSFESTNFITDENADWSAIITKNTDLVMQGKSGTVYLLNLFGQLKTKSFIDGQLMGSTGDKFVALNVEKKLLFSLDQKSLAVMDRIALPDKLNQTISVQLNKDLLYQVDKTGNLKIWKRY
jgi:hypothetical protein